MLTYRGYYSSDYLLYLCMTEKEREKESLLKEWLIYSVFVTGDLIMITSYSKTKFNFSGIMVQVICTSLNVIHVRLFPIFSS